MAPSNRPTLIYDYAQFAELYIARNAQLFDVKAANVDREARHAKHNCLEVKQLLRYRFQIALDGVSARDGLLYQLLFGSVILKERSSNIEYWYADADSPAITRSSRSCILRAMPNCSTSIKAAVIHCDRRQCGQFVARDPRQSICLHFRIPSESVA